MTTKPQTNLSNPPLTIRFHLTDGSVHSFTQADAAINEKLWDAIEPSRLFTHQRIVVGSEHSKSVFVAAEINRVDFFHDSFQCWEFPRGWSDIVELSEEEFRKHARLDEPSLMARREQRTPTGDILVSFIKLQMRGGQPLFAMVEAAAKLPAESQSFMQFLVSKVAIHTRLRGGGIGVLNLANLVSYTVYPGVAQIPGDSWIAEPVRDSSR
jgi:hypothetical protein